MGNLNVGDIVRIRTAEEYGKNKLIQPGSAMDIWANEYCIINEVYKDHSRAGDAYKISFLYYDPERAETASRMMVEEYVWTAECFIKEKPVEIEESAYENLIGGVQ